MGVSYAARMLLLAGIFFLALGAPPGLAPGGVISPLVPHAAHIFRAIFWKGGDGVEGREIFLSFSCAAGIQWRGT